MLGLDASFVIFSMNLLRQLIAVKSLSPEIGQPHGKTWTHLP
jgi:hypothetical protein